MRPILLTFFLLRLCAQTPLELAPDEHLLNKADLFLRQGQLSSAESTAREYLRSHPTSADGHFLLGSVLFLEARAKDSLAEYTEGAKYRTPGAGELKVVASDYVVLGDFEDADKWFTKLLEWTPNDEQAWYDLGRTKYNENRFEEALAAFHHVLQMDPKSVKAEDNLGLTLAALGRNEEAIDAYKLAMTLQEHDVQKNSGPYLDYGSLLVDNNQVEQALPLLNDALTISPSDYQIHRELGKAYLHLNLLDQARAELETAIKLAPGNAPLHIMLAQVYRKQGLTDKAKTETERYTALK